MLVANSFDLWQKDTFFSAAEEVQASADIMESTYRTWVRQRREGLTSNDLDELCRELQTALGTAKWQLDEFQRAIRMSYRNLYDDIAATRHKQFVSAIESKISCVEAALKEYFSEEVKKPLRWIHLDEEERDDLAMFLSGAPRSSKSMKDSDYNNKISLKRESSELDHKTSPKDAVVCDLNSSYIIDVEPVEVLGTSDGSSCQVDKKGSSRRAWSSPDRVGLKITIDHDSVKPLIRDNEPTPKDKGSIWKPRYANKWINQICRQAAGSQRQLQTSITLHRSRSFRLMLVLMLTIFLVVPFVLYSN